MNTAWPERGEVQLTLWKTVGNVVEDPPRPRPVDRSFFLGALVDALANAVDVLNARVEHVEHALDQLMAAAETPLTQDELIARLRRLREDLSGE